MIIKNNSVIGNGTSGLMAAITVILDWLSIDELRRCKSPSKAPAAADLFDDCALMII